MGWCIVMVKSLITPRSDVRRVHVPTVRSSVGGPPVLPSTVSILSWSAAVRSVPAAITRTIAMTMDRNSPVLRIHVYSVHVQVVMLSRRGSHVQRSHVNILSVVSAVRSVITVSMTTVSIGTDRSSLTLAVSVIHVSVVTGQ